MSFTVHFNSNSFNMKMWRVTLQATTAISLLLVTRTNTLSTPINQGSD